MSDTTNALAEQDDDLEPEAIEPEAEIEDDAEADDLAAGAEDEAETPEAEDEPKPDRRDEDGKIKAITREREKRRKAQAEAAAAQAELARYRQQDVQRQIDALDPAEFDTDDDYDAAKAKLEAKRDEFAPAVDQGIAAAAAEIREAIEEQAPEIMDAVARLPASSLTPAMIEYAAEADDPVSLIRYLAENPDEAAAIGGRTPTRTVLAMQKIERRLMAKTPQQQQKPAASKRTTTSAPDPIEPVRSSPGARTGNLSRLAQDEDISRFSEALHKERTGAPKPANRSW